MCGPKKVVLVIIRQKHKVSNNLAIQEVAKQWNEKRGIAHYIIALLEIAFRC